MPRRIILFVLLLLAAGGGWLWWGMPSAVAIAMATSGPALQAVYATGNVEPVHWARVGPAVRARVTDVMVEEGQRVTEGQPLAHLDNREARHRVEG